MSRRAKLVVAAVVVTLIGGTLAVAVTRGMQWSNTVAATVNGEIIYSRELDSEVGTVARQYNINLSGEEGAKQRAEITQIVLDQMIEQRLITQEARKRGALATDAQVEEQVASIRQNFPSEEEFLSALAQRALTLAGLRERLRISVTVQNLMTTVSTVTISDAETAQYFREHRSEFDHPEQVHVKHILLPDEDNARLVLAMLRRGEKFENLARRFSIDPGSRDQGGDLGFISRGQVVPEFEQIAFTLPPKQVSDIVRTQFGFHIILMVERRAPKTSTIDEVRDQIRAQLLGRKQEAAFQEWLKQVKAQARITKADQKPK